MQGRWHVELLGQLRLRRGDAHPIAAEPGTGLARPSGRAQVGTRHLGWLKRPGLTAGIFGVGYALSRILVEVWRVPDIQLGYLLGTGWLTMGMVLSLPILAAGIVLIASAMARPRG